MNATQKTTELAGFLNINKPAGITSRTVVDEVAQIIAPSKAGHAGTLDPLATGVLVVGIGGATRLISHVQDGKKRYRGRFVFGKTSDTDDMTGDVVDHAIEREIGRDELKAACRQFVGTIEQVPPQYSAVHVNGKRAYKLARQGKEVNLPPRQVEVAEIRLSDFAFPEFELEIECGSGTYIRSIGRDIGQVLGCGAVMSQLERTSVGPFCIDRALDLSGISAETVAAQMQPLSWAVTGLPQYVCSDDDQLEIVHGRRFVPADTRSFHDRQTVAIMTLEGELACLAEYKADEGRFAPRQVYLPRPLSE